MEHREVTSKIKFDCKLFKTLHGHLREVKLVAQIKIVI
jgi:hypothetical protein